MIIDVFDEVSAYDLAEQNVIQKPSFYHIIKHLRVTNNLFYQILYIPLG